MKSSQLGLIVLVVVVIAGALMLTNNDDVMEKTEKGDAMMENVMKEDDKMMMADSMSEDAGMMKMDSDKMMMMKDKDYHYSGDLADVSGGTATGTAMADYSADEGYMLYATFDGLPALEEGFFYEGWVVRRGDDFSVISSSALEMVDGVYTNSYASETDLTDHTFYVLTLEPDDGDPAPAEHILEGVMEDVAHDHDDEHGHDDDKMMKK